MREIVIGNQMCVSLFDVGIIDVLTSSYSKNNILKYKESKEISSFYFS